MLYEIFGERVDIETQKAGMAQQVGQLERACLEQPVVHRPEHALRTSGLGRFGRDSSIRMCACEREVTEHERKPVAELALDGCDIWMRERAVRAFEVAVLDELHRRVDRPRDVITRQDRQEQPAGAVRC